ncbi:hypothetical protein M5X17_31240 [Paenibacillus alvei]|uniref:hypothetical protein n=1 Tax=Paenibacillus alvei TaxID=44250 RepID=UPI00227F87F4|nr:hypothetical protein [Paenibacillus alvei]MCY9738169.1 hypothetical protein [Paenibacillus alvei]
MNILKGDELKMLQDIIDFKNKDYITDRDLDHLIKKIGRQNLIFEIQDNHESDDTRYYIIQDRDEIQKYNPHYKIYLISTDLVNADDFYVMDFVGLIRRGYINVHCRFDLLYSKTSKRNL